MVTQKNYKLKKYTLGEDLPNAKDIIKNIYSESAMDTVNNIPIPAGEWKILLLHSGHFTQIYTGSVPTEATKKPLMLLETLKKKKVMIGVSV